MDIATRGRLQRLANEREALIREMENAGAALPPLIKGEDGIFRISLGTVAQALFQRCYDDGWVERNFDWGSWSQSADCRELQSDRSKLQTASPDQLKHLLTMLIRQDRFSYGAWTEALKSGLLLMIVERAHELGASNL